MEHKEFLEKLQGLPNFTDLNTIDLLNIVKCSYQCSYRKEMSLYYQGEPAETVYLIISGTLKKVKYRADESSLILEKNGPGDWIGLPEIIANGPYLTDAVSEEQCELFCFSKNNFKLLLKNPLLQHKITEYLARHYYTLHANLESRTPLQKIVRFFRARVETFETRDKATGNFIIEITQEALAESIGYTRETTNKHLKELEDKKVIRLLRGRIEIINHEELNRLML